MAKTSETKAHLYTDGNGDLHHVTTVVDDIVVTEDVLQAVGEASMCWERPGDAGVFDSARAVEVADRLVGSVKGKRPYRRKTQVHFHWVDMDQQWAAGLTRLANSMATQAFLIDSRDGEVHVFVVPPAELSEIITELGDGIVTEYLGDTRVVRAASTETGDDAVAVFVTTPEAIRFSY